MICIRKYRVRNANYGRRHSFFCVFLQFSSVISHWVRSVICFCIVINSSILILFVSDKVCTSNRRGYDGYVCRTGKSTVHLSQDV